MWQGRRAARPSDPDRTPHRSCEVARSRVFTSLRPDADLMLEPRRADPSSFLANDLGLRSALYASQLERLFGWLLDDTPAELRHCAKDVLMQLGWDLSIHLSDQPSQLITASCGGVYNVLTRSPKLLTAEVLSPHADVIMRTALAGGWFSLKIRDSMCWMLHRDCEEPSESSSRICRGL